jgi:tetratricopeptide (TPR) repeat protein
MLIRLLFISLTMILLNCACMGSTRTPAIQEAIESGNDYLEKGDLDRAIADYDRAIELDPDYAHTYFDRGFTYRRKGDQDRAIADYDRAIELDPDFALAFMNRGLAYLDQEDLDRASADFRDVLRISNDPNTRWFAEEQLELLGATP